MTTTTMATQRGPATGAGLATLLATCAEVPTIVRCGPHDLVAEPVGAAPSGRTVIVLTGGQPLAAADPADPLVFRTTVDGEGHGPLAGGRLRLADVRPIPPAAGDRVLATALGHPVAIERTTPTGTTVVLGTDALFDDAMLATASNARLVAYAIGAADVSGAVALVRGVRAGGALGPHATPCEIDAGGDVGALLALVPGSEVGFDDPAFWRLAGRARRALPAAVHDALVEFADDGHPSGALVVRGLPVGNVPPTPPTPRTPCGKDRMSELVLLAAARGLGQPVGYAPEHGGDVVQNLVPTRAAAGTQSSTSSSVLLEFHTEAAFHPHKPRYLLLLGLRADPSGEARTLLCSIDAVLDGLTLGARAALAEPRFRTSADESYTGGRSGRLGRLVPVLSSDPARPALTFDADLMCGDDAEAAAALDELRALVRAHHTGVALGAGDLLVVDNHRAVHGRSPFRARYDGTDRWLQRTFVVSDLAASAGERDGRTITTRFAP